MHHFSAEMFIYLYLLCFCFMYPSQHNIMGTAEELLITTKKSRPTVKDNRKVFFVAVFLSLQVMYVD